MVVNERVELRSTYRPCLGFMACVTACPPDVKYDALLEVARPSGKRDARRSFGERAFRSLIFANVPYPRRLRLCCHGRLGCIKERPPAARSSSGLLTLLPQRLQYEWSVLPPITFENTICRREFLRKEASQTRGLLLGVWQRVFFGT